MGILMPVLTSQERQENGMKLKAAFGQEAPMTLAADTVIGGGSSSNFVFGLFTTTDRDFERNRAGVFSSALKMYPWACFAQSAKRLRCKTRRTALAFRCGFSQDWA